MEISLFEKPLVMGHRGFQARYPENTMVSFRAAVDAGAQFLELDVTMTRDRQVVVIHDDTVDRTTDGRGPVSGFELEALKQLDAGLWFHPRFTGERIPSLDEVLTGMVGDVHINIEIKSHQKTDGDLAGKIEQAVIDSVQANRAETRVLISSFDHRVLQRVKELRPEMRVALISEHSNSSETLDRCRALGVFSFHPNLAHLERDTVNALHAAGIYVFPYNIESDRDVRQAFKLGVDGLIAKDPLMVRQCYLEGEE